MLENKKMSKYLKEKIIELNRNPSVVSTAANARVVVSCRMRKPYIQNAEAFTEEQLVSPTPCASPQAQKGRPSARMVLCKGYGPEGFKFFTNYASRKAEELNENPYAYLNFYWEPLKRCVRIEGAVTRLPEEESTAYFMSRPVGSRIGAMVSPQSQPISSRQVLIEKEQELTILAEQEPNQICKPDQWGGYLVIPESIEFWQGQTSRLHDRIRFRKLKSGEVIDNVTIHEGSNGWVYERLAP